MTNEPAFPVRLHTGGSKDGILCAQLGRKFPSWDQVGITEGGYRECTRGMSDDALRYVRLSGSHLSLCHTRCVVIFPDK